MPKKYTLHQLHEALSEWQAELEDYGKTLENLPSWRGYFLHGVSAGDSVVEVAYGRSEDQLVTGVHIPVIAFDDGTGEAFLAKEKDRDAERLRREKIAALKIELAGRRGDIERHEKLAQKSREVIERAEDAIPYLEEQIKQLEAESDQQIE